MSGTDIKYYQGAAFGPMHAQAATGAGKAIYVADYPVVMITLSTSGSASGTLQFAGSIGSDPATNYASAASTTNIYDFIQVKDRQNDQGINGSTGIVLTGTDTVRTFEFNTNGMSWFCPVITAYAAGSWNVDVALYNPNR